MVIAEEPAELCDNQSDYLGQSVFAHHQRVVCAD